MPSDRTEEIVRLCFEEFCDIVGDGTAGCDSCPYRDCGEGKCFEEYARRKIVSHETIGEMKGNCNSAAGDGFFWSIQRIAFKNISEGYLKMAEKFKEAGDKDSYSYYVGKGRAFKSASLLISMFFGEVKDEEMHEDS